MFFITLLSLAFAKNKIEVPKYSQLLIAPDISQSEIDKSFDEMQKNPEAFCTSDEAKKLEEEYDPQYWIDYCVANLKAMQQVKVSDGSNVNSVLKDFKKENEFLIVIGMPKVAIDFSNLKTEMIVSVSYETDIEASKQLSEDSTSKYIKIIKKNAMKLATAHFDKSHKSIMKYVALQKKNVKDEYGLIEIVGDVKGKVSFLICFSCRIKISNSDLNVPYSFFSDAILHSESKNIKSNHFISDVFTTKSLNAVLKDKIKVNQYGILLGYYDDYDFTFQIVYHKDSWGIKYGSNNNALTTIFEDNPVLVPYSSASVFNLLVYAFKIDINLEADVKLEKYSSVNLTLIESFRIAPNGAKKLEKDKVQITASGWDAVAKENRPKVSLQLDSESFEFTKSENDPFEVSQQELYSYKPKNKKSVNVGMIVGIVVACVVVVAIVIVVVVVVLRKKKVGNSSEQ